MNYKKLLITFVFILAVLPASAQLLPFSLEVRGGINRSEPSVKHDDNIKEVFSYRADAVLDFKMGLGLFTRTGLTLTEKNGKSKYNDGIDDESSKIKAQYLEIPAMVGYKLGIPMVGSVNVAGGMYFGYGIGGKSEYSFEEYSNGILIDSGKDKVNTFGNVYKRFDTGLAVSAGIEFSRITFNVGYEHGLLNVAKNDDANIKNRSVYASLGFRIL